MLVQTKYIKLLKRVLLQRQINVSKSVFNQESLINAWCIHVLETFLRNLSFTVYFRVWQV